MVYVTPPQWEPAHFIIFRIDLYIQDLDLLCVEFGGCSYAPSPQYRPRTIRFEKDQEEGEEEEKEEKANVLL